MRTHLRNRTCRTNSVIHFTCLTLLLAMAPEGVKAEEPAGGRKAGKAASLDLQNAQETPEEAATEPKRAGRQRRKNKQEDADKNAAMQDVSASANAAPQKHRRKREGGKNEAAQPDGGTAAGSADDKPTANGKHRRKNRADAGGEPSEKGNRKGKRTEQ